jgi:peroxiredoxin
LASLEASGIHPVAISADTPEESRELCRKAGLTFPILSDRNAAAIRSYDLLVSGAGEDGRDIAGTAEFLLDSTGTVRWRKLFETNAQRFVEAARTSIQ